jgi:hypothetical protein
MRTRPHLRFLKVTDNTDDYISASDVDSDVQQVLNCCGDSEDLNCAEANGEYYTSEHAFTIGGVVPHYFGDVSQVRLHMSTDV